LRAARLDAHELGRQWLRPFWDALPELGHDDRVQLALATMELVPGLGADWLPRLEAAVNAFSHEPAVVVAVGLAFAECQLWGKARPLLEQSGAAPALPPGVRRRAWRVLATLARDEADEARARRCEQAAADID
ncbi:MAG: heme biosynthesis protein HemY, partial [Burkholderiaceae bacterium]|nr:heme biosynthesis protein HemY [Burkholderiaceae bacterium]